MTIKDTLGNEQWMRNNETAIRNLFPETWTHMQNIKTFHLCYNLKLLDIDWRTEEEFAKIMLYFDKIKIILRDGYMIRRNPNSIFSEG